MAVFSSVAASSSAWLPLLYDTVVFSLLAYRIVPMRRDPYQGYTTRVILTRLLEDGLIYYMCVSFRTSRACPLVADIFHQSDLYCHVGSDSYDCFRGTRFQEYYSAVSGIVFFLMIPEFDI